MAGHQGALFLGDGGVSLDQRVEFGELASIAGACRTAAARAALSLPKVCPAPRGTAGSRLGVPAARRRPGRTSSFCRAPEGLRAAHMAMRQRAAATRRDRPLHERRSPRRSARDRLERHDAAPRRDDRALAGRLSDAAFAHGADLAARIGRPAASRRRRDAVAGRRGGHGVRRRVAVEGRALPERPAERGDHRRQLADRLVRAVAATPAIRLIVSSISVPPRSLTPPCSTSRHSVVAELDPGALDRCRSRRAACSRDTACTARFSRRVGPGRARPAR